MARMFNTKCLPSMFKKLEKTKYLPGEKPLMAWDGECGFCHYWVIKWKLMMADNVTFKPFQDIYKDFPDVELKYFRQAIRFIDTDGKIYTGPAAVFQALHRYGNKWKWVMPVYAKLPPFRFLSDRFYAFVSKNRVKMYDITIRLFGRNPARPKRYWAYYLTGILVLAISAMILT